MNVMRMANSRLQQSSINLEDGPTLKRLCPDVRVRILMMDTFMGAVIVVNTLVIGLSLDFPWSGWIYCDAVFAFLFCFEILWKLSLFGCKGFFTGCDAKWHIMELVLACTATAEVVLAFSGTVDSASGVTPEGEGGAKTGANVSIFRIVRLFRVGRIVRVCRLEIFQDLMVMINGALAGVKTLFWAMVMIGLPLYGVALLMRQTVGDIYGDDHDSGASAFSNVGWAFFMVFRAVVNNDDSDSTGRPVFLRVALRYGPAYAMIYMITTMLMTFGLFNVIVAIFVDNVLSAQRFNDQLKVQQRLKDQKFFTDKMSMLIEEVWRVFPPTDGTESGPNDGMDFSSFGDAKTILQRASTLNLTLEQWDILRSTAKFTEILFDLDISSEDQINMFDTLDADSNGLLDLNELLDGVAKLRGNARRSDMVQLMLAISNMQSELKKHISVSQQTIKRHDRMLKSLVKDTVELRESSRRSGVARSSTATTRGSIVASMDTPADL